MSPKMKGRRLLRNYDSGPAGMSPAAVSMKVAVGRFLALVAIAAAQPRREKLGRKGHRYADKSKNTDRI